MQISERLAACALQPLAPEDESSREMPASGENHPSQPSLTDLPGTLFPAILHHLDSPSIHVLRATSKHLRKTTDEAIDRVKVPADDLSRAIARFPQLKAITVRTAGNVEQLMALAQAGHCTHLSLAGCEHISLLPDHLPPSLVELDLSWCRNLAYLPEQLPANLSVLNLEGCCNLARLPDDLPPTLNSLILRGCRKLAGLPEHLPQSITELDLTWCRSITQLTNDLPQGLQRLNISLCKRLTQLPANLPAACEIVGWNPH